jgi:hypothetical protein
VTVVAVVAAAVSERVSVTGVRPELPSPTDASPTRSSAGCGGAPTNAESSVVNWKRSTEVEPARVTTPTLPSPTAALYDQLPSTLPFSETVTTVAFSATLSV